MHNVTMETALPSGSDAHKATRHIKQETGQAIRWSRETYIAITALLLISAYIVCRFALHWSEQHANIPLLLALGAGVPLLFDLVRKLVHLEFGADLIAGVSIVSAILMQQYLVASVVILMLSGGQALENYATRKASSVLQALAKRMPTEAHLIHESSYKNVVVDQVHPGDVLLVFPHEICPVDGQVVEGYGRMDESLLTGEPFELSKAPGSRVISGAVNADAMLTIRALKPSADSQYACIMRVVRQTEQNQPRLRRIGDRLGAWYTPLALAVAGCGWLLSGDPHRFLAVAVIATPCPLLLAIPVAILGGISLAARRGIVIRNAAVLEHVDSCRTFIFDKTGTLTYGRPVLTEIHCAPGYVEEQVLCYAASLETYSRHPLANGILSAAQKRQIVLYAPANVTEHPGEGLRGTVESHNIHITGRKKAEMVYGAPKNLPPPSAGLECLLYIDGHFAGLLKFQDEPKADSSSFIQHLSPKHHAQRIILLSGDKESEVRNVASLVGIDEMYSGNSPEEKLAFVQAQTRRARTLFVGDGINDAPSMLAATAGVAMGGTSEAISESADAVVLDSSLRKIDELIHIGRRMKKISLQSAVGGVLLSSAGMAAAAAGHLSPLNGAIAQEIIDLVVVLNALRVAIPTATLADF